MSEHKIILDPRLEGKLEYHITAAYVESVLTDEEATGLYEPVENTEHITKTIQLDIGTVHDMSVLLDKVNEVQAELLEVSPENFESSIIKHDGEHTLIEYKYSVTLTIYTEPVLYFQNLWQQAIRSYLSQAHEYEMYLFYKERFEEFAEEF